MFDPTRIPTLLAGEPPINVPIRIEARDLAVTAVSMGNPHAVIYVDEIAAFPLEALGPQIEHHAAFPRRVNVHVVEVLSSAEVQMRTWERGSGITLACGTGACAICVAGVLRRIGSVLLRRVEGRLRRIARLLRRLKLCLKSRQCGRGLLRPGR